MTKTLKEICEILSIDYLELMTSKQPYKNYHKALVAFCYIYRDEKTIDLVNCTNQRPDRVRAYIREGKTLIKDDAEFEKLVEAFESVEA